MALTQTDKDCLKAYHGILSKESAALSSTQRQHLEDILTGDEAARVAAAKYYAENVRLVHLSDILAGIDQQKTDLEAEQTALQAYIS